MSRRQDTAANAPSEVARTTALSLTFGCRLKFSPGTRGKNAQMTYTIESESPYVVSDEQRSEGGAPGQQFYVDPSPQVTYSGGNLQFVVS